MTNLRSMSPRIHRFLRRPRGGRSAAPQNDFAKDGRTKNNTVMCLSRKNVDPIHNAVGKNLSEDDRIRLK